MSQSNPTPAAPTPILWSSTARQSLFNSWLAGLNAAGGPSHGLTLESLRLASADASFRRYFRVDFQLESSHGSRIIMDAPPDKEDSRPFVEIASLMAQAGLNVPQVLAWDVANGFLLLSDLGTQTMMQGMNREDPQANHGVYMQAVDALITWQLASKPGVLPAYDEALLRRELALFPDWYLAKHRGVAMEGDVLKTLNTSFDHIVTQNLTWPSVFVHRDFMPRNLMAPTLVTGVYSLPPEGANFSRGGPSKNSLAPTLVTGVSPLGIGILDFQDAVYGPITYDIASLMRDAFLTWEEDFVLDITIRYWQKARQASLPVGEDFGEFYKGVEWMGLQRHLKVAGIFARLTLRDGKPQYLADTPRFIHYIRTTCDRYRELKPLLRLVDRVEGFSPATGFAYGRI
jgi:N-acetylmuramate 1-kinase